MIARFGYVPLSFDGPSTPPVVPVTWDAATVTAVTLSGGNLVATNTGTTSADQGARVASSSGKSSGKYYFEMMSSAGGSSANFGTGVGTTTSTYTGMGNGGTTGAVCYRNTGTIWINGGISGSNIGQTIGGVVGIAADLDNEKIWFKKVSDPPSNWNGNVSADPATNVGGLAISVGIMVPFCVFGGSSGTAGNSYTANFGGSGFTGVAPAGFASGWPQ